MKPRAKSAPAPLRPDRPMTPRQLAQYLQVSPSTLARQMRTGVPHFRVGGQVRFLAADVVNHFRAKKK